MCFNHGMNEPHTSESVKEYPPPYVAVSRLQEALKLLTTRSINQVTPQEFTVRNFSKSDAFQTVSALKFLGLINDDGTRTSNITKLQLVGEDRTKGLQEIVKSAYSKLFSTVPDANKLSRQELYNEFLAVYHISPRLATTVVPAFIWLCKESGLDISAQADVKQRKISGKARIIRPASPIQKAMRYEVATTRGQGYEIPFGSITLVIPNTEKAKTALLEGKFKDVAEKLSILSKSLEENASPATED